ncbi:MAG: peroxiredoxin family protein [Bacteroidota bacterium]
MLFLCVVLLLFNALLVYQNQQLKETKGPPSRAETSVGKTIRDIIEEGYLYTQQGDSIGLPKLISGNKYVALVFFSAHDCPMCLEERRYWNMLASFDSISVFGIVRAEQWSEELKIWLDNLEITFPVLLDKGGTLTNFVLEEFGL